MSTFDSNRLIEALKRKRFATGKLAETLEIPVDVLHKMIVTSEGDDLIVSKLNALLNEAEPEEVPKTETAVTEEALGIIIAQKWTIYETDFQDRLSEKLESWSQKLLEEAGNKTFVALSNLLTEAFIILTPAQRLKQATEEGKFSREQILAAENKSPVPRTTVLEWASIVEV